MLNYFIAVNIPNRVVRNIFLQIYFEKHTKHVITIIRIAARIGRRII